MSATHPGSTPASQPNAEIHDAADLTNLLEQSRATAPAKRGYLRYELPESVTMSMYWKGPDADRFFGMWEPTAGEVRKLAKADADFSETAPNFIAALGVPTPTLKGLVHRGSPTEAEPEGPPVLADVSDNTAQVMPWWERLPSKAQALVTSMFVELIMPTADEGKSLRDSRKWVG